MIRGMMQENIYKCIMLAIFNSNNNTEQFHTTLDKYITQKAVPPGKATSRELGAYIHLAWPTHIYSKPKAN